MSKQEIMPMLSPIILIKVKTSFFSNPRNVNLKQLPKTQKIINHYKIYVASCQLNDNNFYVY